jgi:deoxyribodipyrimidine photo-lyase
MLASHSTSVSQSSVHHVDQTPSWMLRERTRVLRTHASKPNDDQGSSESSVVYWMQRDVRTVDNWALLYASHVAQTSNSTLRVVYCLLPPNPSTDASEIRPFYDRLTERYGSFLLGGLQHVHTELADKNIPLHVLLPPGPQLVASTVLDHLEHCKAHIVIGDHSPLKPYRTWWEENFVSLCESRNSNISIIHVDAHNVVPVWHASPKREIGARTLRTKLNRLTEAFLDEFPSLTHQNTNSSLNLPPWDQERYIHYLNWDTSVPTVDWAEPGTRAGMARFKSFTETGLPKFAELRNNPNEKTICSHLSPWINHGHISFQRLAQILRSTFHKKYANGTAMFLEEGLVRRELSDNFVYYTPRIYDSMDSALSWAQETLQVHASDPREWDFSTSELETSRTHDDLWNAAQLQLVQTGKLHGFVSEQSVISTIILRVFVIFHD